MNIDFNDKIIEITNTNIQTLHPKDTLKKAIELFKRTERNILPVTVSNQFKGVLINQKFYPGDHKNQFSITTSFGKVDISHHYVEDYMATEIKCIAAKSSILNAMEFFVRERQYFLPILHDKQFVGLVTPYDVFKYILLKQEK